MAKNYDMKTRLRNVFTGAEFDVSVIMNTNSKDSNFLYLTGFISGVFEQAILVSDKNGSTLLTNELEYDTAIEQAPNNMEVKCVDSGPGNSIGRMIKDIVGSRSVGLDYGFLPYNYASYLRKILGKNRFYDATKQFANAREIKDEFEIRAMRKAVSITREALKEIPDYFKSGMTENELRARFEYILGNHGGEGLAFESIVSFGSNAALPHHTPDNTRLKPNEFVLLDVGAKYQNYCADMTRTFIFEPDKQTLKYKRMKEIIDTVKEAQQMGLAHIKAGANGSEAHNAVTEFINTTRNGIYKGRFIHSLGHQIGIDVHDGNGLSPRSKILREGMVVSDEPGIYITGFGGARFEDDVLVGKKRSSFL
ncbi:MAG: Xaa-Pro peptidase family protein [Candidatus Marsarchaeota archaeon]|jgi:Xaa-Pro dipeptidase|nr:Xaa-Pro peptidase family protein [Candidatus Marsarchaeota archaeon]